MRIISGNKKGIRLINPEDYSIRPTSDKVKEALFDIIAFDVGGSYVLDLFAGTGALGIEALSRDAAFCVFVDRSKRSIDLINKNLKKAKMDNGNNYLVLNMDFSKALMHLRQNNYSFDLIFVDPPYHDNYYDRSLELLTEYGLLRENGKVILELSKDVIIEDNKYGLINFKEKTYGNTTIKIYSREHFI